MHETLATLSTSHEPEPNRTLEATPVFRVGPDERGHRHMVHSHDGSVVAFPSGGRRPMTKAARTVGGRRRDHVRRNCYKTWDRLKKERAY